MGLTFTCKYAESYSIINSIQQLYSMNSTLSYLALHAGIARYMNRLGMYVRLNLIHIGMYVGTYLTGPYSLSCKQKISKTFGICPIIL